MIGREVRFPACFAQGQLSMKFQDLRPQRNACQLLLKVGMDKFDLRALVASAFEEKYGSLVSAELLEKGLQVEPQECYLAWVGSDWQAAEHCKRGQSREEALQYLYTEVKSLIQRLGSVSRKELENRRQVINLAIRKGKKDKQLLASALADADTWTISKYARRVAKGIWSLGLDVRMKVQEGDKRTTLRHIWMPGGDKLESADGLGQDGSDFELTPDKGWPAVGNVLLGRPSSGSLDPIGRTTFELEVARAGRDAAVVRLAGFLDNSTVRELEQELHKLSRGRVRGVVVDMRQLTYVNSTGLGTFVKFRSIFQELGGDMVLVGVHAKLMIVLEMLGLDIVFEMAPNARAGLRALRGRRG